MLNDKNRYRVRVNLHNQYSQQQGRHNDYEGGGCKFVSGASEKSFLTPPPLAYLGGHKTGYYRFHYCNYDI